jgi:hypothetical protein
MFSQIENIFISCLFCHNKVLYCLFISSIAQAVIHLANGLPVVFKNYKYEYVTPLLKALKKLSISPLVLLPSLTCPKWSGRFPKVTFSASPFPSSAHYSLLHMLASFQLFSLLSKNISPVTQSRLVNSQHRLVRSQRRLVSSQRRLVSSFYSFTEWPLFFILRTHCHFNEFHYQLSSLID